MGDEETPLSVQKLSDEDVLRYLAAQSKSPACLSCGQTAWVFYGGNGDVFLGLAAGKATPENVGTSLIDTTINKAVSVVAMVCAVCGFIRMHDMSHVLRWLEKNPNPSDKPPRADATP
jgi:hypothetical protein